MIKLPPGLSPNLPTPENAIRIFDNWISRLPIHDASGGTVGVFDAERDARPIQARIAFGPFDEFNILELGSFEGGHSYQLERLGAKCVTGIEANAESFLKSLVIKEVLGLRAKFLYGDFLKYLETSRKRYDLIFASGVLYHMTNPLHLLRLISQHADRTFIWSHYVPADERRGSHLYVDEFEVDYHGFRCRYYRNVYTSTHPSRQYSGPEAFSCHMLREDILGALRHFGYGEVSVIEDAAGSPDFIFSIAARRA